MGKQGPQLGGDAVQVRNLLPSYRHARRFRTHVEPLAKADGRRRRQQTEAVDVGFLVDLLGAAEETDLFRRYVGVFASKVAADQRHARVARFRDAEIDHLREVDPPLRQQNIARRNVAMGLDPLGIDGGEALGEAHDQFDDFGRRKAALIQHARQRLPVDELHDQVAGTGLVA